MVTHKFFKYADDVDEFLNSDYIEVISITSNAYCDNGGEVCRSYTVFYKI